MPLLGVNVDDSGAGNQNSGDSGAETKTNCEKFTVLRVRRPKSGCPVYYYFVSSVKWL